MHLDHQLHTSHCLLLADWEKAHLDKALGVLLGQKEMVQLDKELALQGAGLEHLQVGNAHETVQELQGWWGNDLELLGQVDIVQVSQDQGGTHPELKGALDIALGFQGQSGMETALELLGQMIHQQSQLEQKGE